MAEGRGEDLPDATPAQGVDNALDSETSAVSGPWCGYSSDQGEPGDNATLSPALADNADDDERIKAELCGLIGHDAELDARDVDVDTAHGVVVLKGSVGSEDTRRRIELVARGVPGVRSVENSLDIRTGELQPPGERGRWPEGDRPAA